MRQIDFKAVYGKLGNHPGGVGPQAAQILFQKAMEYPENSRITEVGSEGGRATIVLGYAARNKGAKVVAYDEWNGRHPRAKYWFDRGIKTHGLQDVVEVGGPNGGPIDLLVLGMPTQLDQKFADELKAGGTCILLGPRPVPTGNLALVKEIPEAQLSIYERAEIPPAPVEIETEGRIAEAQIEEMLNPGNVPAKKKIEELDEEVIG